MPEIEIISACLGLLIGLALALTGAGGATLSIPLLVFAFDLSVYQAGPIALLAVFTASSIGALQGLHKGTVRYKSTILIAAIGMLLAPLGVKLAQNTPNQLLSIGLVGILLFIGILSWYQAGQHSIDNSHSSPPACMVNPATSQLFWTASCTKRLIGTGAIAGLLSGLLGVGGGFVIVPSLNKVSNFNPATVVTTTLATIALISASSISSHIHANTMDWRIAIPFAAGTTLAMLVATEMLTTKIPKQISEKVFSLLCLVAAIQLAISTAS